MLLIAALFDIHTTASAQKNIVTGTVTDSINKALPFVSIQLVRPSNLQLLLQSGISKEDGSYQMNVNDTGSYVLRFSHLGFVRFELVISVQAGKTLQLEPVQLKKSTASLAEVVVKKARPLVEQGDDRIIFNVEDDPASKSETAIDLLRKAPFVTVDGEDNIKVNGKSNFKVLLNGRETSMFANNIKEALRAFPGALVQKIEVITSPSAKYDGEGIGGLINIITKKKVAGYNGTISSFSRTSDKLNDLSVNGNAKFGRVGASIFYDFGGTSPVSQPNENTTVPTNTAAFTKRTLFGDQRNNGNWQFGNAELSWEADSLNTFSLYANIDSWNGRTVSEQTIVTDFSNVPSLSSLYKLNNKTNTPGISAGTDYIKKFSKNKEREFTFKFFGEFGKSEAELNSSQDNPVTDRFLVNQSHAVNNQYTLQADHSVPTGKNGKLDAGLKAILRRASSDFESLVKYDALDKYELNPANTDKFKYAQDVLSVYSMYSIKIKKSNLRVGARLEYTNVDGNFISSGTTVKNAYSTFLPNIQFTNKLSDVTTLTVSYNKRLSRPYISDLNPFVFNNDSLNISFGNPRLGPQTIHSVAGQLRYGKGTTFAGAGIEGSYSDNKILDYAFYDAQSGVTKTTSLNIGKEYLLSLNLNLNAKLTPKWSLFINGSLRYSSVTNTSDKLQSNSGFGGNFNFNHRYQFTPKFSVSNYIGFWKDPITIQTTYPFSTWYNLAFNYKVFKDKLNISIRAVNFFEKDRSFETITRDMNFYTSNINTRVRRGVVLSLTFNFGKLTESVSKKQGVTNDDLLSKPQATSGN